MKEWKKKRGVDHDIDIHERNKWILDEIEKLYRYKNECLKFMVDCDGKKPTMFLDHSWSFFELFPAKGEHEKLLRVYIFERENGKESKTVIVMNKYVHLDICHGCDDWMLISKVIKKNTGIPVDTSCLICSGFMTRSEWDTALSRFKETDLYKEYTKNRKIDFDIVWKGIDIELKKRLCLTGNDVDSILKEMQDDKPVSRNYLPHYAVYMNAHFGIPMDVVVKMANMLEHEAITYLNAEQLTQLLRSIQGLRIIPERTNASVEFYCWYHGITINEYLDIDTELKMKMQKKPCLYCGGRGELYLYSNDKLVSCPACDDSKDENVNVLDPVDRPDIFVQSRNMSLENINIPFIEIHRRVYQENGIADLVMEIMSIEQCRYFLKSIMRCFDEITGKWKLCDAKCENLIFTDGYRGCKKHGLLSWHREYCKDDYSIDTGIEKQKSEKK